MRTQSQDPAPTGRSTRSRNPFTAILAAWSGILGPGGRGASSRLLLLAGLALLAALVLGVALASAAAPTVTVEPASAVSYTTAHVEGTVDPGGESTSWRFQYVTEEQFQENLTNGVGGFENAATGLEGTLEGSGVQSVPPNAGEELTGLAPDKTYHLRLLAENGGGPGEAVAGSTFTTKAVAAPVVTIEEAAEVSYASAKGEGSVELAGADPAFDASCSFQYIPEAQFQENLTNGVGGFENADGVPCEPETVHGSETQPVTVTANIAGLHPDATYHLRLVAGNAGGTSTAVAASTFTTETLPAPTVSIDPHGTLTGTTVHLSGHVNPEAPAGDPEAADVTWHFQCASGCSTPEQSIAADDAEHQVEATLEGLEPGIGYEVFLVAQNAGGSVRSATESFTTPIVAPTVTTGAPRQVTFTEAALNAEVDPGGTLATTCRFEYGETESYGHVVPCVPAHPAVDEVQNFTDGWSSGQLKFSFEGQVTGALPAFNPSAAEIQAALESLSTIGSGNVSVVTAPGSQYHITFEGSFSGQSPPTIGIEESIIPPGAGGSSVVIIGYGSLDLAAPVGAQLSGLAPGTLYHYRVVASNSAAAEVDGLDQTFRTFAGTSATTGGCPNEAFRTGPSATLPDCRAYEMVTEDVPGNPEVYVPVIEAQGIGSFTGGIYTWRPFEASSSGEAVAYVGDPGSVGGQGAGGGGLGNQFVADRLAGGGWRAELVAPTTPDEVSSGLFYQGFSADLATGVFSEGVGGSEPEAAPLSAAAPRDGYSVLYAQAEGPSAPAGEARYQPLFREPIQFERGFGTSRAHQVRTTHVVSSQERFAAFAGGSADFRDLLFEDDDSLLPPTGPHAPELRVDVQGEVAAGVESNYLYDSVEGRLSLVDVSPAGTVVPDAAFGAPALANPNKEEPDFDHVISADGSRVYWTAQGSGRIYLREDPTAEEECSSPGEADKACTVPVSAGGARYWTATPDGRYAFYTEGEGTEARLWRFDSEGGPGDEREALTPTGSEVQGVIGASEDGSKVYFVAGADLTGEEEDAEGEKATSGEPNLYLSEAGTIRFVTTLAATDGTELEPMWKQSRAKKASATGPRDSANVPPASPGTVPPSSSSPTAACPPSATPAATRTRARMRSTSTRLAPETSSVPHARRTANPAAAGSCRSPTAPPTFPRPSPKTATGSSSTAPPGSSAATPTGSRTSMSGSVKGPKAAPRPRPRMAAACTSSALPRAPTPRGSSARVATAATSSSLPVPRSHPPTKTNAWISTTPASAPNPPRRRWSAKAAKNADAPNRLRLPTPRLRPTPSTEPETRLPGNVGEVSS